MRVLSGLMFFPRGGSAHVARALARTLPEHGCDVTILSGSLPGLGDAGAFYDGLDVHPVDFAAGDAPMHPSYEDRPGAPDPVFARVGDDEFERHVDAWAAALERVGAAGYDVLHLHHLTPINEAAARVAPEVPVVAHLHGTELLMLERIAEGNPDGWPHAESWARRMREWAAACDRIIVLARGQVPRAVQTLGVDPERCLVSPNGFEPSRFAEIEVDRRAHWRRVLCEEPHGWLPGGPEGSVAYDPAAIERLLGGPILVSVSRFTAVKRTGLMIRAFERARRRSGADASLVLVGGHPGEWEGEHPAEAIAATGTQDVYLAGWQDHTLLAESLRASDAIVLASVREQFGAALVEGMACGLPAIAVDRFGPAEIVENGRTGWLVEPDDEESLARAIEECIGDGDERRARGVAARRDARRRFSWPSIAKRVAGLFEQAAQGAPVES